MKLFLIYDGRNLKYIVETKEVAERLTQGTYSFTEAETNRRFY